MRTAVLFSLGNIGEFFLLAAFASSICQFLVGLSSSIRSEASRIAGIITFGCCFLSFCILLYAFGIQDYTLKSVYFHSHSSTPFFFRLAASWGHHEGSFLLWTVFSTWYGFFGGRFLISFSEAFRKTYGSVIGLNAMTFLGFIIFVSNPFEEFVVTPVEGQDLNPLLQDVSLLIHPPFLYMGFVGFLVPYAYSIAYLLYPEKSELFHFILKKVTAIAWGFLTLGIGMGSFWAYYELGWGGYWFWDPVENASLIPWLGACILIHSLALRKKQKDFERWSLGWAILLYPLSILGTFLVRSGLLTSIHAFAFDPKRGVFIFCIMFVFFMGGVYCLIRNFKEKAHSFKKKNLKVQKNELLSSLLLLTQNGIFTFFLGIVFLGTIYPIFSQFFFKIPSYVGPTYYVSLMKPFILCMLILLLFFPSLIQRKLFPLYERPDFLSALAGLVFTLCIYLYKGIMSFMDFLFVWASLSVCIRLLLQAFYEREKKSVFFGHLGISIFILGVFMSSIYAQETQLLMKKGDKVTFSELTLKMEDIYLKEEFSYLSAQAKITEEKGDFSLVPERRFYKVRKQETSEIALAFLQHTGFLSHLYVRLGEEIKPHTFEMHFKYYPLISLVWVGWGFIAIAAFFVFFSGGKGKRILKNTDRSFLS